MIRISTSLFKTIFTRTQLLNHGNKSSFAKEAKPAKGGKDGKGGKQQKKQQAPVEQQASQKLQPYERIINYFTPLQVGLSPSEQQALNNNFSDLQDGQKQILDQLAGRIAQLNTSMFYDLTFKREALGTSEGFVVGSAQWEDEQVKEAIKVLRKDV